MKVVKFGAVWCPGCSSLKMTLAGMDIKLPIEEVDIDSNTEAAATYGIRSIPTMILVDENDNQIRRVTGNLSADKVSAFLGEYA